MATYPVSRELWANNLDRLCSELDDYARVNRLTVPTQLTVAAKAVSGSLFLAHSASSATFAAICANGRLRSAQDLANAGIRPLKPDCAEAVLGTAGYVFFYVAPFRYPNTACGFLFATTLEGHHTEDGAATPFDSGGVVKHTPPLSGEPPRAFFDRHILPIPEHRQYLGKSMDLLYARPEHYYNGAVPPPAGGPIGLGNRDMLSWTHEVRIPDSVHIRGGDLQAVFAPVGSVGRDPDIDSLFEWCKKENVDRVTFYSARGDEFAVLQRECIAYIGRKLQ